MSSLDHTRRKLESFDPEGKGYDYGAAERYRVTPDQTGHWQSRVELDEEETKKRGVPRGSGLLLKGRGHPTWSKTEEGEKAAGYEIFRGPDGRYYSMPMLGGTP